MRNVKVRLVCVLSSVFVSLALGQEMCSMSGSAGVCQVQAPALTMSTLQEGCAQWAGASYQGTCQNGKLEGPGLIRNPHSTTKVSFYYSNFSSGIPDDPVVAIHREAITVSYVRRTLGVPCVWFEASGAIVDDVRRKNRSCITAANIYGSDMLSDASYQNMLSGKFVPGGSSQVNTATPDDPKTVGRGMRGG